jgi:carboxyl-terminal processing protease
MAMGVGNWFINEPNQKLGTLQTRDTSFKFVLNPRAERFTGPLAILVDRHSASTSEILAGGLQDLKRARIFGTRTAGAALPAQIVRLPNGDGFLFAFANYISEGGKVFKGRGVHPDAEVPLQRQALLAGKDAVLDAAVQWIQSQKRMK